MNETYSSCCQREYELRSDARIFVASYWMTADQAISQPVTEYRKFCLQFLRSVGDQVEKSILKSKPAKAACPRSPPPAPPPPGASNLVYPGLFPKRCTKTRSTEVEVYFF